MVFYYGNPSILIPHVMKIHIPKPMPKHYGSEHDLALAKASFKDPLGDSDAQRWKAFTAFCTKIT